MVVIEVKIDIVCKTLALTAGFAHMSQGPDCQQLYATAESQAGYRATHQARGHGIIWGWLFSNVGKSRFVRVKQGIYRLTQFLHKKSTVACVII